MLLENECRTNDPLPCHLDVEGLTYENLISIVLRESNMTRVYAKACVQVQMRVGKLFRNMDVQRSETFVASLERGFLSKPAGRR